MTRPTREERELADRLGVELEPRTLRIVVADRAVPAGSKTQLGGHGGRPRVMVDSSGARGKNWRREVRAAATAALEAAGHVGPPPFTGPLAVAMTFYVTRAKRPAAGLEEWPAKAPDVLKLARAVEDALTNLIWTDDALIVSEMLHKGYGPTDRLVIVVGEVRVDGAGYSR